MGKFFKIFPNLSQNWLKLRKILEKSGDFVQNWSDSYINGSQFFEKLVLVWATFKLPSNTPYQTELEYPPPRIDALMTEEVCGVLQLACYWGHTKEFKRGNWVSF